MVYGEARRAYRLQHRVAQPLAIVDLVGVGGLEQQAAQAMTCISKPSRVTMVLSVDMVAVGQVPAHRRFLRYDFRESDAQGL